MQNFPSSEPKYHRVAEVCEITGLSRASINMHLRFKSLKSIKRKDMRLIPDHALQEFVRKYPPRPRPRKTGA